MEQAARQRVIAQRALDRVPHIYPVIIMQIGIINVRHRRNNPFVFCLLRVRRKV